MSVKSIAIDEMIVSIEFAILQPDDTMLIIMIDDWKWLDIMNEHIVSNDFHKIINILIKLPFERCMKLFKLFVKKFTNIKNKFDNIDFQLKFILPIYKSFEKCFVLQVKTIDPDMYKLLPIGSMIKSNDDLFIVGFNRSMQILTRNNLIVIPRLVSMFIQEPLKYFEDILLLGGYLCLDFDIHKKVINKFCDTNKRAEFYAYGGRIYQDTYGGINDLYINL